MARTSKATVIIEDMFFSRWDPVSQSLSNPRFTLEDVRLAILSNNASRPGNWKSPNNPANFMKDVIRATASANNKWPSSVLSQGYTARQLIGGGYHFEFIPLQPGQTVPFPPDVVPPPTARTPRQRIGSASLPLAWRRLGRGDEPWLMQVIVRLGIIEAHLALFSPLNFVQVDLLQMSVKLRGTEIDALYLGVEGTPTANSELLITCEAKGHRDDILVDQVLRQARAAFSMPLAPRLVVPVAVKAFAPSQIHIVEFEAVSMSAVGSATSLPIAGEAVFELVPNVPGVGT